MRSFVGAPGQAPGDEPMWSPMSSTLIAGEDEGILVDTLVTVAQVDALAEWAKGFQKRIVGVYITHGHQDHWRGLGRLQEHFPDARGMATAEVVGRASFEMTDPGLSGYWNSVFPGELPEPVLPETISEPEFEIEGQTLKAIAIGQVDTEFSTVLHVPSAEALVGGDVVYNRVHMMTAETDDKSREAWIASLDAMAALNPKIVVAGHKRGGCCRRSREHWCEPAVPARLHSRCQRRRLRRRRRCRHAQGPWGS
jgi:glyoxylase-like metal-dependent hydrolase (beta-lactamase superfamily II)